MRLAAASFQFFHLLRQKAKIADEKNALTQNQLWMRLWKCATRQQTRRSQLVVSHREIVDNVSNEINIDGVDEENI